MSSMTGLWEEHKARLRGYITNRVRDRHVADDILQDVYLKAHVSLHTVRSPGSISGWLTRIAANAIADHYRAHRSVAELPDDLVAPELERDLVAELATCLHPLIDDLPEIYRTALTLSEIDGITQGEVARRLGISVSGAKSRVQRGRRLLRDRILQCCEIENGSHGIVDFSARDGNCGCDGV